MAITARMIGTDSTTRSIRNEREDTPRQHPAEQFRLRPWVEGVRPYLAAARPTVAWDWFEPLAAMVFSAV